MLPEWLICREVSNASFHQAAGLIGIAQQPDYMREIIQRRCPGVMTPPTSERSVNRRIIKLEHRLQLLPRLSEFPRLECSKPGHAVQDETTRWIAFAGKPGARALGNQCGSAIVTAGDGTYECPIRCDEQTLRVTQASCQLLDALVD